MARYNENKISYKKQAELLNSFCRMLSRLKNQDAIYNFIKDLLNRQERMMLIRRLLIAEMLSRGCSYLKIRREMGCGSATIARIQRWLKFGRGGYLRAIKVNKGK
jgi:TrpR-related protein YerC/YecD